MKQAFVLLLGVLALSACAAAAKPVAQIRDVAVRRTLPSARTKAAAVAEAEQLLAAYTPPRGAVRLKALPAGFHEPLAQRGSRIVGKAVDRNAFWRLRESASAIEKSIQDRRLPGWGAGGTVSTGGRNGGLLDTSGTYAVIGFGGRSTGRLLRVTAVRAPGGGSLLRVDVIVGWQLSAAEREDIPAGVHEVDIRGPHVNQQVTDPTQVRTIVRWFDHLEIYQQLFLYLGCPFVRQPSFTFDFRAPKGSLLARATVPEFSGVCSAAAYEINGHSVTPLLGGDIVFRVQELIGANWIGSPDESGTADRRKAEAQHEAALLLHGFRPPPGAYRTRATRAYGGVLTNPGSPFGEFVDQSRYWRVRSSLATVISFVEAHDVPVGFKPAGGQIYGAGRPPNRQVSFYRGNRTLVVSAQETRTGTTIVRVDSQVGWVYPRSPKERIRASRVREIDFSAPKVAKKATDPAVIARIVRWFDALPIVPPGEGAPKCALFQPVPVTLDFRGAGGLLLAHVSVEAIEPKGLSGFCNPIDVRIGAANQPSLLGGNFIGRVQRELGVSVSAPSR